MIGRLAVPGDMPRVKDLLLADEAWYFEPLDLTACASSWVVVEDGSGSVVGAIQVSRGLPIGRAEEMAIDRSLDKGERARCVTALIIIAMTALKMAGAQMIEFLVPENLQSYKDILVNRGAVEINHGTILMKRV